MVGAGSITVQTRDLDEAIEAVTRVYSPHETAVTGRPTDLNVVLRVFGRTAQPLVSLSYGTEVSIDAGEFSNFIAMTKCARGSASARQGSRRVDWRNGQTMPFSPGLGTDFRFDRTFSQTSVRLDIDRLERLCGRLLGRPLDRQLRFVLQPFSPELQRLWDRLLTFLQCVNEDQLALGAVVAASLDDFILTTVLQGHPHSFTDDLAAPVAPAVPRIVRCAERYMAENAAAPLTIADIALEVGVSVRALQAGFREWRQTTPMAALRHIRLQCARAALLEPDEATEVTDVALRWGFAHLGRFSASYKAIFDETPGSTLRRRRSRAVERR
jgi:AraC-like DNA-binding protein